MSGPGGAALGAGSATGVPGGSAGAVGADREPGSHVWSQSLALSRRSIVRLARQPASWVPGMAFPLLLAAVNASAMSRVADVCPPGGRCPIPPGTTFLQFLLPAVIIQGVLFGGIAGGTELAIDIQTGFFDRLMSSPVARPAILAGRLAGAAAFGAFQAVVFQLVLWPFGADVAGGPAGRLVIVLGAVLLAVAVGCFSAGIAARTGQPEAVQGFFPLVFIGLFISSCFFPTELMSGWFKAVATHNPLTYLVNGLRHQVVVGWGFGDAAVSLGVSLALVVVLGAFALRQFAVRTGGDQ